MTTLQSLQEEMKPYKGTLVIDWYNVVLLKDVIDGEDDYYWVYHGRLTNGKRQDYHATCVGSWIPLKGFISDEKYERLVAVWNLNHDQENQAI